jgi:hypothetical protein
MKDLDRLARSMPLTTCELGNDGRPSYRVKGTLYLCHRSRRPDAVDERGERLDDVLMFRVPDLDAKEALLADRSAPFFTTSHFDGYPAVLLRIRDLRSLSRAELFELVADAWLAKAHKRVAAAWLAEQPA